MWTCQSCQTQNPKVSSFCQTCGERPSLGESVVQPKPYYHSKPSVQETKERNLDLYYRQANRQFGESDFSLLATFGTFLMVMSSLVVLGGIISMVISWATIGFWVGIGQFVISVLIAIPGFVFPNFIDYLLELKQEVNQTRQELYVSNQINDKALDTLEKILVSIDKTNSNL